MALFKKKKQNKDIFRDLSVVHELIKIKLIQPDFNNNIVKLFSLILENKTEKQIYFTLKKIWLYGIADSGKNKGFKKDEPLKFIDIETGKELGIFHKDKVFKK